MYENLIARQREYFRSGATRPLSFRLKQLRALKKALTGRQPALEKALRDDLKRSGYETFLAETSMVLTALKTARQNTRAWAAPRRVKSSLYNLLSSDQIQAEPLGVVLIISPWNYPIILSLGPLIAALSAGNCALIKPSELATASGAFLAALIGDIFPPEYVSVVQGEADTARELLKQNFDHIFFTGSTQVGRQVMEAAARHLTPVTLELGGKSPCLVTETADLALAAKRIVWGKLLNCGQTCIAPDYVLAHFSVENELIYQLNKAVITLYGPNIRQNPEYPRIINRHHFDRLSGLMDQAKIIWGGSRDPDDLFIEPTIMRGVDWADPVMGQEIFGPILPVMAYDSMDRAIEEINRRDKPLALYLFTADPKEADRVWAECSFGGGCVNDTLSHFASDHLPFGGVGASGMGAYHGRWGFDAFSHYKSRLNRRTSPDPPWRYPPYSAQNTGLIRRVLNWLN